MRSQRQLRVGEELRHALAAVFQRGDIPLSPDMTQTPITVTEVRVSPDLKNATAFVMPLGGRLASEIVEALNARVGFFRHELARAVKLRYVPKLGFAIDDTFDNAKRIDDILNQPDVARDLAPHEDD